MPPGMPMRARGGGVKSKGMDVGTKVQHDKGKDDIKDMNRGRVVTFKTGGGVVSFNAGGKVKREDGGPVDRMPVLPDRSGDKMSADTSSNAKGTPWEGRTARARGGRLEASQGVAPATKLPGGAGGGKGRLAKARKY